ncbi:MAG: DUF3240 family protein [Pseudomonadota bacterium]|nr:DUF3240 family protein [Pseudomonadota bacterium]
MQTCLLKFIVDESLNDLMSDVLLAYPEHGLKLTSYLVQTHHQGLAEKADIREQVSGFKQQVVFEITLNEDESQAVYQYVEQALPYLEFEAQLLPLQILK